MLYLQIWITLLVYKAKSILFSPKIKREQLRQHCGVLHEDIHVFGVTGLLGHSIGLCEHREETSGAIKGSRYPGRLRTAQQLCPQETLPSLTLNRTWHNRRHISNYGEC
jgi:hypothetical protein